MALLTISEVRGCAGLVLGFFAEEALAFLGEACAGAAAGAVAAAVSAISEVERASGAHFLALERRPGTDLLENVRELPAGRVRGHEPVACFLTWFAPSPGSSSWQAPIYRGFAECGEDSGCRGNRSGRCQVKALGWGGLRIRACNPGLVSTAPGFVTWEDCMGLRRGMSLGGREAPTFGRRHTKRVRSRLHPAVSEALQKLACIEHNFGQGVH